MYDSFALQSNHSLETNIAGCLTVQLEYQTPGNNDTQGGL